MSGQLPLSDGLEDANTALGHTPFEGVKEGNEVIEHPFRIPTSSTDATIERHESIDPYQPTLSNVDPEKAQTRPDLHRTASGYSVALSVKKVPRSRRAGLFGRFTILYEAEEPKDYPRKIKWTITLIIAICAVAAPMGSAIILRNQQPIHPYYCAN